MEAWFVGQEQWFTRTAEEWIAFAQRLKQMACPHCKVVGMLIRQGYLFGYDESNLRQKAMRAQRIFCSNRQARRGCGRTFNVWIAEKIRRLSLTTHFLWEFVKRAVGESIAAAIRAAECHLCPRSLQRVWRRFGLSQCQIRTALMNRGPPPELASQRPAAQVLAHLQAVFPNAGCPIAAFQFTMRTFFM